MEKKVAILGIMVKSREGIEDLNKLLTEYGDYIIGRMGIPHIEKAINIICIIMDAPKDIVDELCDKIKELDEITVKSIYND